MTTSSAPVHGDGAISVNNGSTVSVWYASLDMTATATIDGQMPVISNVVVSHVNSTSFTVTWQTNELARSIINYSEAAP